MSLLSPQIFTIALISIFLSACSSLPENLDTTNESVVTDYQTWVSMKDSTDVEVRLGGVIASVTNLENRTRVEVVNLPIDSVGKPDINLDPEGRFVAYVDGFVDPVSLAQGRLITFLGQSQESEVAKVGDYDYRFPVLKSKGFHLWRIEERIIMHDYDDFGLYPCRSLYCRDFHYGPREGRVIQQVR